MSNEIDDIKTYSNGVINESIIFKKNQTIITLVFNHTNLYNVIKEVLAHGYEIHDIFLTGLSVCMLKIQTEKEKTVDSLQND